MEKSFFFKNAAWVGKAERTPATFTVLRGHFEINELKKVTLNVLGLGFFKCYINGNCVNPDTFLPLSSDFEATGEPAGEVLSGHRVYVPSFDITPFVTPGENVIAIYFGGGYYTRVNRIFGQPRAIYCITEHLENGEERHFVSDENCRVGDGFVVDYWFVSHEDHDYNVSDACLGADFDDSVWEHASLTEGLEAEYCTTDCPVDKLISKLPVKVVAKTENGIVYDCGKNTTGYPVLEMKAPQGQKVVVRMAEGIYDNGALAHVHGQTFTAISDGSGRMAQPEFTWFGFRYFEVTGDATPVYVKEIYADVERSSTFVCDNETLNWTYNTFMHTMLCNMHTGFPSDCPHLERAGYTGDGQLTCHATLTTLDAKKFYQKWMQDIADGQDKISGHVQYTAPYLRAGGGPGGWASAVVEVPYQLYKHYGDVEVISKYYDNMRRYIDYLEAHSEFGLVTSDKEGEWCLGDWCCPNILYPDKKMTFFGSQTIIPAAYVNTYFMVKSLQKMREIAKVLHKDEDVAQYDEKISERKRAIKAAYFNPLDGSFIMNVHGANSFAVDLGIGDENTYKRMVNYYQTIGGFDTGIFATDVLIRTLFENGDGELAVDILTGDGPQGYENWRKSGATTFLEYWDPNKSRSHCHPMFGAPVAYFFEYLLGIKQAEETCGYSELVISPQATAKFGKMSGSMETPNGTVAVSYEKAQDGICFSVTIPVGSKAVFRLGTFERALSEGENTFTVAQ